MSKLILPPIYGDVNANNSIKKEALRLHVF